jgi:hypothetical protein
MRAVVWSGVSTCSQMAAATMPKANPARPAISDAAKLAAENRTRS